MKSNDVFQFRVTPEQLQELHERAAEDGSAANVIRESLGWPKVKPGRDDPPLRGGVAGSTGGSEPPSAGSIPAPGFPELIQRINQLVASGTSRERAERQARKELS